MHTKTIPTGHKAPMFAPRTRVVERNAQNARTGRIRSVTRYGLALVEWANGSTSYQTTFNLVRATER